mmetsp:Transcript_21618/g.63460  ORF Transcript_21618/g.63460 Transcript_21618/m.63460 type:complete len:386 (-) Transcript_21618:190-1347(-)
MSEQIDVIRPGTLEGTIPPVEASRRFVVYHVAGSHGHLVETISVIVHLHRPRLAEVALGNVDDEGCGVRRLPIDVGQQSCPLLVPPQAVHVGLLQLHPGPRLHQFHQPRLPSPLESPRYLYEIYVDLPPIDKDPLAGPFLLLPKVAIVVVECTHGRKDVVGQTSLPKTQRGEGAGDSIVSIPFLRMRASNFVVEIAALSIVRTHSSADASHGDEFDDVIRQYLVRLAVPEAKGVAQVRFEAFRIPFGVLDLSVGALLPLGTDPVQSDGMSPGMIIHEAHLGLLAPLGEESFEVVGIVRILRAVVMTLGHDRVGYRSIRANLLTREVTSVDILRLLLLAFGIGKFRLGEKFIGRLPLDRKKLESEGVRPSSEMISDVFGAISGGID